MFYNIVHQSTLPSGFINNALIIFSFRSKVPLNKSVEKFSKSLSYMIIHFPIIMIVIYLFFLLCRHFLVPTIVMLLVEEPLIKFAF